MENQDYEQIRQRMAQTRASLSGKLTGLQSSLGGTVAETASTVSHTVDAVSDTVDSVKKTVRSVQHALDLPGHVQRHPWLVVGGAVALGCILAQMTAPRPQPRAPAPSPPPPPSPSPSSASQAGGSPGLLDAAMDQVKGLALGTLIGVVRNLVSSSLAEPFQAPFHREADEVSSRLGATHRFQPTESPATFA